MDEVCICVGRPDPSAHVSLLSRQPNILKSPSSRRYWTVHFGFMIFDVAREIMLCVSRRMRNKIDVLGKSYEGVDGHIK